MNFYAASQMLASPPLRLTLKIRGIGHVPSFKNHKMLCRGRLITDPKKQKWMKTAIRRIILQLNYSTLTVVAETPTANYPRSLTAWLPQDDNWQILPKITIESFEAEKGDEGFEITLEKI